MTDEATVRRKATADRSSDGGQLAVLWVYPELAGRVTFLPAGSLVLGRDFGADVRLPGEETSRQHAEIVKEGAMVFIRDLGSTNGVYVGGRRVEQAPLDEGSVVRIGDWIGVVARVGAAEGQEGAPVFDEVLPGYFAGPKTRGAMEPLRTVAPSDLPVIVQGETGTGKEGVARAAHAWSGRPGPFVAVNCAAVPETLAEGELFGYRKGAFTGADRASPGHFQAAHRGTLFLDEVADLPAAIQPKLLRALEQHEVMPLGEARAVPVDVRVVVATQAPLQDAVAAKRFRADLFARLNGLTVRLPPLRSRLEEVPSLFARLLAAHATGTAPAMDAGFVERLCCYRWPLNVRELALLARKLLALHGREGVLKRSHIPELAEAPPGVSAEEGDDEPRPAGLALASDELEERRRIMRVLEDCAGSQTEAARRLNLSRSTLIERLKRYGIPRPRAGRDA
jgi:transcriptional regulator of acetoin/glycerol metabolism